MERLYISIVEQHCYSHFPFQIVDPFQVYDNINLGRRIDPMWPDEQWRARGGRNNWKDWLPEEDMEGEVLLEMIR